MRLRLAAAGRQRPRELTERIVALEVELRSRYTSHRCVVDGRELSDNEVDDILRTSQDVELRRQTWEATRAIGERTGALLREVAHLRNGAAQALGYRDHYAMSMAHDELDEDWLFALLDELDRDLAPAWDQEKAAIDDDVRAFLGLSAGTPLLPWHYQDRFFQEAPSPADDPLQDAVVDVDVLDAARRLFVDQGHDVDAVLARWTCSRGPARTSTRSSSRSTGPTTCASCATSRRRCAGSRRRCTSSATRSTTSASTAACTGCCASPRTSS